MPQMKMIEKTGPPATQGAMTRMRRSVIRASAKSDYFGSG
jgi:hypothetical protein